MKILFVSYHYWPPHFGGELKISIERFTSLIQRGNSVTVLTSGVPGFPKEEINQGIKIIRSPMVHNSRFGRALRRLIFPIWASVQMNRIDFDILHHGGVGGIEAVSNFLGMLLVNTTAHRKRAKTVIVHSLADTETDMFCNQGFKNRMRNAYLKNTDAIVSVSPALYAGVKKIFPDKSRLISNCVRDDIFIPLSLKERRQFRKENRINEDNVIFSFLGTVSKRKGADLLLSSFSILLRQFPHWRLWIIGPKDIQENKNYQQNDIAGLMELLENNQGSIRLWGRIDDRAEMARILGSSDVFVFPTRKEGMPLAPMEAMSSGLPVIISRLPGVTDLANIEGVTGFYIEVGDAQSLKSAMVKLARDSVLRKRMGIAAHKRIKNQFGWEQFIDQWVSLYASLIH